MLYGDIEVDDFNKLYSNPDLIEEQFGESIQVRLQLNKKSGAARRQVLEDESKVTLNEAIARSG